MAKYDKADLERRMHGAVESLKHDLAGLRTGRAHSALLDPVTVEVYGAHMPLNQVASISAPEPRDAAVGVIMPLLIIGGIVSGVFTATESAAVAVGYSLFVGFFVFRTL